MLSVLLPFSRVYVLAAAVLFAVVVCSVLSARLFRGIRGRWFIAIGVLVLGLSGFLAVSALHPGAIGIAGAITPVPARSEPKQRSYGDAAIWQHGIENHLEADVYPSKSSAMYALGLRMAEPVRRVLADGTSLKKVIVFRGNHDRNLPAEFARGIDRSLGGIESVIERESVAVEANEVGIRLDFTDVTTAAAPWPGGAESQVSVGTLQATVLGPDREASAKVKFTEKAWVGGLQELANADPNARLVLARSEASCTTEAQANREAIENACAQLTSLLVETGSDQKPRLFGRRVTAADILGEGLIVDRFVQSFEGKAGRIWRQALLVDASSGRLSRLLRRKASATAAANRTWGRMFITTAGLLGLIVLVYAFLNAATKGYYMWSLRAVGVIIALICVVSILLFLSN